MDVHAAVVAPRAHRACTARRAEWASTNSHLWGGGPPNAMANLIPVYDPPPPLSQGMGRAWEGVCPLMPRNYMNRWLLREIFTEIVD